MPKKIRELKRMLRKAGFSMRPGKGSHTVWYHLGFPGRSVTVSGRDGDDAKKYQEHDVIEAIETLEDRR